MSSLTSSYQPHPLATDAPVGATCKNCRNRFTGHFCNECGQQADTHRITWHFIWHEIPHSVWHVDHGILFTLKELFTRPGYTIREFLEGKRVRHYRPLALVLLLGAVLTFVLHSLDVQLFRETQAAMRTNTADSERIKQFTTDANAFFERYFNIFQLAFLPVTAFFHWLLFRRKGLNYPEHLVANTFLLNGPFVLLILAVLGFKLAGGSQSAFSTMMITSSIVSVGYHVWAYVQLFEGRLKPVSALGRVVAAYVLNYMGMMLIIGLFTATYIFFLIRKQPEPVKTAPRPTIQTPHK